METDSRLSTTQAVFLSLALMALLTYSFFYDRFMRDAKQKRSAKGLQTRLSLDMCGTLKNLSGLVKLRRVENKPAIHLGINKVMELIREAAKIGLGDFEGSGIEATLLLFDDEQCENIRVANRTTQGRPSGQKRPSTEIMAYYVAKSRKYRVVNDFMRDKHPFPKVILSGGSASYRSILFIPLLDKSNQGQDTCMGVVTVDSTKPYHFWPKNGEDLVFQLTPYCILLALFLNLNEPYRLTCSVS